LTTYPGIHEVAVVGSPHDLLGEAPVAFVSANGGAIDLEALQAFCRSRLPTYKMPVRFVFRSELPKIAGVGKIDRVLLRELAAQTGGGPSS